VRELDLDSVGIHEVEDLADASGYRPELRSRNTRAIKPIRPCSEIVERRGLEREVVQYGSDGVEPLTRIGLVPTQIEHLAAQDQNRRAPWETTLILTLGRVRHHDIGTEHVAVEANASVDVGYRDPLVMQSDHPRAVESLATGLSPAASR
jgi:hypothetical protein